MAGSVVVVGNSRAARIVANILNAPSVDQFTVGSRDQLIMVVAVPADIMTVRRAISQGVTLAAVVAWELAEDNLGALVETGVPVVVGMADAQELNAVLSGDLPPAISREDVSRMAAFENLLTSRPRGELTPPQSP